jgi:hypothetical protein
VQSQENEVVETAQPTIDAPGWTAWLSGHGLIAAKLDGADRERRDAYFLALHASTETLFRQVLFIGFRLNRVPYKDAQAWLHHHDVTPDREKYPRRFDRLYAVKDVSWDALVAGNRRLSSALDLWHDYSKLIRNHLAHGVRRYSPEWVDCAISIDQILLMELERSMVPVVGGSVAQSLKDLVPRLPVGKSGRDLADLMGVKSKTARPVIALVAAQTAVSALMQGPET